RSRPTVRYRVPPRLDRLPGALPGFSRARSPPAHCRLRTVSAPNPRAWLCEEARPPRAAGFYPPPAWGRAGAPFVPADEGNPMKKEMLVNALQPEESRIAIVENGVLEELYIERISLENFVGNIYKGRVVNIEPSIQAAFVD